MKPSEFKLKLEESGFRFTDIMVIKEFPLNGYVYRITTQHGDVSSKNGIYLLEFDKTWGTKSSMFLFKGGSDIFAPDENENNEVFYDDCIKCFNLVDLVFDEANKLGIRHFSLKHDGSCFCVYDYLCGRTSKFVLSFDENDSMFNVNLGFAFYEEVL